MKFYILKDAIMEFISPENQSENAILISFGEKSEWREQTRMILFMNEPKDWKDLQLLTKQLFEEINCRCDIERNITMARGKTCVDVHVTDFVSSPPLIYLCECKYWTSRVPKSVVHSFRTILHDSGANRGYIISKAGFQGGLLKPQNIAVLNL